MLEFAICAVLAAAPPESAPGVGSVSVIRLPEDGLQPEVAVDEKGKAHIVYLTGNPMRSDVMYATSEGQALGASTRVNVMLGNACAAGAVRGAQIAVGKGGRVHIVWNGSDVAKPKAPGSAQPLLYTRSIVPGKFEAERNLITSAIGLDGGGAVAADQAGWVYVAWHAPHEKMNEASRRVFVSVSQDEGATFAPEEIASRDPVGACACCGMQAIAHGGAVEILYRCATDTVHRDMMLLRSADGGKSFASRKVDEWNAGACVMSTPAFAARGGAGGEAAVIIGAWETKGKIVLGWIDAGSGELTRTVTVSGDSGTRKHPALAFDEGGNLLVAWGEAPGLGSPGNVAWQVFDAVGQPVQGMEGRAEGLPTWGTVAAFAKPGGGWAIVY